MRIIVIAVAFLISTSGCTVANLQPDFPLKPMADRFVTVSDERLDGKDPSNGQSWIVPIWADGHSVGLKHPLEEYVYSAIATRCDQVHCNAEPGWKIKITDLEVRITTGAFTQSFVSKMNSLVSRSKEGSEKDKPLNISASGTVSGQTRSGMLEVVLPIIIRKFAISFVDSLKVDKPK